MIQRIISMETRANNVTVLHEHAAHRRIRRREPDSQPRLFQRVLHPQTIQLVFRIGFGRGRQELVHAIPRSFTVAIGSYPSSDSANTSLSNGSRSSIFSPTPT